jgi:hypothetical protein
MSLRGTLEASCAPSLTHILPNNQIILYSRQLCILVFHATTFAVPSGQGASGQANLCLCNTHRPNLLRAPATSTPLTVSPFDTIVKGHKFGLRRRWPTIILIISVYLHSSISLFALFAMTTPALPEWKRGLSNPPAEFRLVAGEVCSQIPTPPALKITGQEDLLISLYLSSSISIGLLDLPSCYSELRGPVRLRL